MTVKKMISYREVWMGLATLWIMVYHADFQFRLGLLDNIRSFGYGGVDIFLLASGIGNYFSYLKDESPQKFLNRRISRIAPSFVPFILLWCVYKLFTRQLRPLYILGNVLAIQPFSHAGINFNWYLAALMLCYVLTPYLACFIRDHRLWQNLLLIAVLTLASTAFWYDHVLIIIATRLPIYTIGMLLSRHSPDTLKPRHIAAGAGLAAAGFGVLLAVWLKRPGLLWSCGMYWYPFILITPFLCWMISFVCCGLEKSKLGSRIVKAVKLPGKIAFEFYLIHGFIVLEPDFVMGVLGIKTGMTNGIRLLLIGLALMGTWCLRFVSGKISALLSGTKRI